MGEYIIEIITAVILFLIASYFIFYKAWLKALGNEVAKLSTVEELTNLEENVKKEFNESLEAYKARLNEELSLKIEPLKAELDKNNITYQIQFGFLHQERAKVILELYHKLIELHSAMVDWTAFLHPVVEDAEKEDAARINRVNQAIYEFQNFYVSNKLFFQKSFCDFIDGFFKEYSDKGWEFGYSQGRIKSGEVTKEYYKEYTEKMSKISHEIRDNFPAKISEIEDKFRKLLKVEDEE